MPPEHEQRWHLGLSCFVPCGLEALVGHARPARRRWSTAVSVVASDARPQARPHKLLLTASRRTRRGLGGCCQSTSRDGSAGCVVLRTMRPGGARGPCPAGLTSVEHSSKRGGCRRTSTSTRQHAAAHGFSMDAAWLSGCCQCFAGDGSVGCRAACHAAWRRSWAMPGQPDIGGAPQ